MRGRAGRITDGRITYNTAHWRLRRERGSASGHQCKCGAQAAEWSYVGGAPDEMRSPASEGRNGHGLPYSADPAYYEPMCRSCHTKRDRHSL